MTGTVLFRENRCDGTAHGGCEAECRIFWKEAWLEHPDGDPAPRPEDPQAVAALKTLVSAHVKSTREDGKDIDPARSRRHPRPPRRSVSLDLSQYIREIRAGNITVPHFLRVALRAVAGRLARLLGLPEGLPLPVAGEQRVDGTQLGLQPGEWVRVRSKEEISKTLDKNVRHRGLAFTEEMTPVVGKVFRVHSRVGRLVHERTGELLGKPQERVHRARRDVVQRRLHARRVVLPPRPLSAVARGLAGTRGSALLGEGLHAAARRSSPPEDATGAGTGVVRSRDSTAMGRTPGEALKGPAPPSLTPESRARTRTKPAAPRAGDRARARCSAPYRCAAGSPIWRRGGWRRRSARARTLRRCGPPVLRKWINWSRASCMDLQTRVPTSICERRNSGLT